ncbi:MAG: prephenate dehydrogenase [bacterium]|nr:prephenate dehydrogenase [bacterium]
MSVPFSKIMVVGLGQMGGSLCLALKNKGVRSIIGIDKNRKTVRAALRQKAITQTVSARPKDFCAALEGISLVVLALPVTELRLFLNSLNPFKRELRRHKGLIFMDVGSTKKTILQAAARSLPKETFFVGAHPIAGTEKIGFAGSHKDLFKNRWVLLSPLPKIPPSVIKKVENFWKKVGGRSPCPVFSAENHDRLLSATSHLPHMIAYSLVSLIAERVGGRREQQLCLGGLKDTTRVASSSPKMWRDISMENSHEIVQTLSAFEKKLTVLKKLVSQKNGNGLEKYFKKAKKIRDRF